MSISSDDNSFSDIDSELLSKNNKNNNKIHIKDDITNNTDENDKNDKNDENNDINAKPTNLANFIAKNKCDAGSQKETHMTWDPNTFSTLFLVKESEYDNFLNIYCEEVKNNFGNLHILEKPNEIGPLYFDFDFKQKTDKRFITDDIIQNIVKCINKKIKLNFELSKDKTELESYVLIKQNPTKKKDLFSDGFHIHYPKLMLNCVDKFLIFDESKKYIIEKKVLSELYKNLSYENEDIANKAIFDSSIIERNKWFMLGSGKIVDKINQYYNIHLIFDKDCDEIENNLSISEQVKLLSVRNLKNLKQYGIINKYKNNDDIKEKHAYINSVYLKNKENNKNNKNNVNDFFIKNNDKPDTANVITEINNNLFKILNGTQIDINEVENAKQLSKMFNKERATDYNTWISVGWALYNISPTLYPEFIEFSKKCPKKFEQSYCEKIWNNCQMNTNSSGGYKIASLYKWAKEDNITEYKEFLSTRINKMLTDADIDTDYDIACIIKELYKYEYVCSSVSKKIWWQYANHKWKRIEQAYSLSVKMSTDVTKEFIQLAKKYATDSSNNDLMPRNVDEYITKSQNITKLVKRLKQKNYKQTIIEEAGNLFYDDEFEEKLDSNPNIIGFNNGVYDLVGRMFRKGCPEDYLYRTIKYDYKTFTIDHPEVIEVEELFSSIQPEKDIKLFLMCYLSSLLEGGNKDQRLMIFIGSGANGKGTLIDLLSLAFECYYGTVPITLLTQKRKGSSNATPELADKQNVRALGMQETEPDDQLQVSYMKELTGQDKIMARPLFGNPFYYTPQFKIIIACNSLPSVNTDDGGTWRRILALTFPRIFTSKPNPNNKNEVKAKKGLRERLPFLKEAFMWLLINIYFPIYKEKELDNLIPAKVLAVTNKYRQNSNVYEEFIGSYYEITKNTNDKIPKDILCDSFKEWSAKIYTHKKDITIKKLMSHLETNSFKIGKTYIYGLKNQSYKNENDELNDIEKAMDNAIDNSVDDNSSQNKNNTIKAKSTESSESKSIEQNKSKPIELKLNEQNKSKPIELKLNEQNKSKPIEQNKSKPIKPIKPIKQNTYKDESETDTDDSDDSSCDESDTDSDASNS